MRVLARLNPVPYHVASLIALAACVILLHRLLKRWLSPPAAVFGAVFFASHPALFHTGYWIIAIGDSLALFFGLLAIHALLATGARRWLAAPLFAISLLCKESTVFLPFAAQVLVAFDRRVRPRAPAHPKRGRAAFDSVAMTMLLLAAVLAGLFERARATGTGGLSYEAGFGPHVLDNALTYLGWTAQSVVYVALPVRGFTDAVDRAAWPIGIGLVVLWLAGLAIRWPRRDAWASGGFVFALLLIPVLLLKDHTYHYYLTAPLIGAALCAGALLDGIVAIAVRGRRIAAASVVPGVIIASALGAWLTGAGAHAVQAIETHPFLDPGSRADPIVDRALILERAVGDLRAAALPPGVTLRFWSPVARLRQRATHPEAPGAESYWERNVRTALLDGLAARVFVPAVREAEFVRGFEPAPGDTRYAVYLPDGHVHVATSAELEAALARVPEAR